MRRAILSIVIGAAFPFCYSIVAGPLSTHVEDYRLRLLLNVPVGWPGLPYFYFVASLAGRSLIDNEIAFLAYIVSCNIILYTLATYFGLFLFSFKWIGVKENSPPLPPAIL